MNSAKNFDSASGILVNLVPDILFLVLSLTIAVAGANPFYRHNYLTCVLGILSRFREVSIYRGSLEVVSEDEGKLVPQVRAVLSGANLGHRAVGYIYSGTAVVNR